MSLLCFFVVLKLAFGFFYYPKKNEVESGVTATVDFINQKLDHFNPFESREFKQKFLLNDTYFKDPKNDPVLINIGGEGPMGNMISGVVKNLAQVLSGGLMVALEHRYYGESCPFDPDNLEVKDYQWLSAKQMIEDLGMFREYVKKEILQKKYGLEGNNKFIVIGGSYSGALSAWARYLKPHLFDIAWSASGVVNTILEFDTFDEQIAISAGEECANNMRKVTAAVETAMADPSSRKDLLKNLGSECEVMDDGDFFYLQADTFVNSVQYGRASEICKIVNESEKDPVERYIDSYHFFKSHYGYTCDSYKLATLLKKNNDFIRNWWMQKCNEVAYFQTAPKSGSIRSKNVDLQYHFDRCFNAFGLEEAQIRSAIEESLSYFGGTDIVDHTSNIWFSNGSQDPWQRATVQYADNKIEKNGENEVVMITCTNCGHCVDMGGCPGGCVPSKDYDEKIELLHQTFIKWNKE